MALAAPGRWGVRPGRLRDPGVIATLRRSSTRPRFWLLLLLGELLVLVRLAEVDVAAEGAAVSARCPALALALAGTR